MTEDIYRTESDEGVPSTGIANWASFKHLSEIEEALTALTPLPWSAHPDPDREGQYYLGGPPETEVVAEGLTRENAETLVYFINALPEALEHFEDLARLWDVLNDGTLESGDELGTYVEIIGKYQMRIAQLEDNPAPVPEASTAQDLTFMHVGSFLNVPSAGDVGYGPITSVIDSGDYIRVALANSTTLLLPPDVPVEVEVVGEVSRMRTGETTTEDDPVDPTSPGDTEMEE